MKFKLHNSLYLEISKGIQSAAGAHFNTQIELSDIYKLLVLPPNPKQGDLAFGCFMLAKALKKAPPQIASELASLVEQCEFVKSAQAAGPYLNMFLESSKTNAVILNEFLSEDVFKKSLIETAPRTIIEYSQPNTHKELHVGHMRNLCYGDALVRINRYCGVETIATTFPGDVGTHVAKCLWYFKKYNQEQPPKERKGAWLGKLYTAANNLLEDQKETEKEDENRTELTQILKELHAGAGPYYDLWKETRQWSVELMQDVYKWAEVDFDKWYWESDVDTDSVALVKEYLDKGVFIKDQGAVGINLEDYKLGFCLLLKSDGTGLYATKDLELARKKFLDHKVDRSLYVVDNRQALHFKQVFKTLEIMGFEQAKDCHHLQYEMVELTDGAMSSRKGNIVPLQELIDRMVAHIKTTYLSKYENNWSSEEIDNTANIVAAGAIKYGMNRTDANKKIVFDMDEWLKLDGESGPYIQYVYARINSMLEKLDTPTDYNLSELNHEKEIAVINHLTKFNQTIQTTLEKNATHILCQYIYQLAKLYNSFYAECSVAQAETQSLREARTGLSKAVSLAIKNSMGLLGIKVPERM